MAYQGGYGGPGGPQRPYAGPAAQPPSPRGFNDRPPPARQYAPRPSQDGYRDVYAYDDRAGGYAHQDQGYGQPQDFYPPAPRGRGGPPARPSTAEGRRGDPYPPRSRGMDPGGCAHPPTSDHGGKLSSPRGRVQKVTLTTHPCQPDDSRPCPTVDPATALIRTSLAPCREWLFMMAIQRMRTMGVRP